MASKSTEVTVQAEALPPQAVISSIATLANTCLSDPVLRTHLVALAGYCLPPSSGVSAAIDLLINIQPDSCPLKRPQLVILRNAWNSALLNNKVALDVIRIGSRYPLFFGLRKLAKKLALNPIATQQKIVDLYLRICAYNAGPNDAEFSSARYYVDILSMRDALLDQIGDFSLPCDGTESDWQLQTRLDAAVETAINKLGVGKTEDTDNDLRKLFALRQIIRKERRMGVPAFVRSAMAVPVIEPVTDDHPVALPDGSMWGIERVADPGPDSEQSDDEPNPHLVRITGPNGSRSTLADDLHNYRVILQATEARNTVTHSDLNRLPLVTVRRYVAFVAEKNRNAFYYLWLLLLAGLNPQRLEQLCCGKSPRPARHKGMYLDVRTGLLSYEVINGSAQSAESSEIQDVSLGMACILLPMSLVTFIAEMGEKPFARTSHDLDQVSRGFCRNNPGTNPTPERLARSYWLYTAPHIGDSILAAFLTGNIPTRFRAEVRYYRITNTELHAAFHRAHKASVKILTEGESCTTRLRNILRELTPQDSSIDGELGSRTARPPELMRNIVTAVQHAAHLQAQKLSVGSLSKMIHGEAEALNIRSLNLFLMQQFAHSLRPVGQKAHVDQAGSRYGGWVKDKNSSFFGERRRTPLPKMVIDQMEAAHRHLTRFQKLNMHHRIPVHVSTEVPSRGLAYVIKPQGANDDALSFIVTAMTMRDALGLLDTLRHSFPFEHNVARHVLASEWRGKVTQPRLDAFLGHNRGGFDMFSPYSSAVSSLRDGIDPRCEDMLKQLGFRVIR